MKISGPVKLAFIHFTGLAENVLALGVGPVTNFEDCLISYMGFNIKGVEPFCKLMFLPANTGTSLFFDIPQPSTLLQSIPPKYSSTVNTNQTTFCIYMLSWYFLENVKYMTIKTMRSFDIFTQHSISQCDFFPWF